MSSPHLSATEPNKSHLSTATYEKTELLEMESRVRMALLGLCATIAVATSVGGLYSLFALSRMKRKTSLCLIVASMSVDDLVSVVPLSIFMLLQWGMDGEEEGTPGTLCVLSGLLYVFQGVSSNMKACLIAAYTFYVTKRFGAMKSLHRPWRVTWGIAAVWCVSLAVSALPLCGWGSYAPAPLGCFPERRGSYSVLLLALYSVCFTALLFFFVSLTYQLLCSREPQRTLFYPSYLEISKGLLDGGSAPLCEFPSCSRDSLDTSFNTYSERSPVSFVTGPEVRDPPGTCGTLASCSEGPRRTGAGDSPAGFAQKRFSMILAVVRVILWMPIMTLALVRHTTDARLPPLETLGYFLTLLAPAVTPLFALSERWNHLPCGCFIHCRREPAGEPKALKRRFEFSLSFQQGYRVYKLSPAAHSPLTASAQHEPSYHHQHHLFHGDLRPDGQLHALDPGGLEQGVLDFGAVRPVDSSSRADLRLETSVGGGGGGIGGGGGGPVDGVDVPLQEEVCGGGDEEGGGDGLHHQHHHNHNHHHLHREQGQGPGSEAPERRLSHEECRKIELSDWEWCRSKSERTPRQRSMGGLSVPLCAFQGTVSLQAPTGKTLSLSTYEVSSDGLKISPTNAKKVEVYRSKSVGHEPSADDAAAGGQAGDAGPGAGRTVDLDLGMGLGMTVGTSSGVGDTNVKIHLEVLEICDNEEAMDSVSIVSNISQSSAHTRSPSLRYSRRENRFVSCDLGETASYSLLIPSGGSPVADGLNISIPDTVEGMHRQNSRRQTQDTSGYKEEIQLLNEAYMRQEDDREE